MALSVTSAILSVALGSILHLDFSFHRLDSSFRHSGNSIRRPAFNPSFGLFFPSLGWLFPSLLQSYPSPRVLSFHFDSSIRYTLASINRFCLSFRHSSDAFCRFAKPLNSSNRSFHQPNCAQQKNYTR